MARPLLLLVLSATILSCTEKNIIMPVDGSVSGYLSPAVGGALIRTSDSSISTFSRDDGFFLLQPVPPGTQDVIIDADGYSRRVLHEIIVSTGRNYALGKVTLSQMPYPVFYTYPEDDAKSVSTNTSLYLSCDDRLDFSSLSESAVLTPLVEGTWLENDLPYPGGAPLVYHYSFVHSEYLELNTTYTLTIPASTKMLSGTLLGRPIEAHFTTSPLVAKITIKAANGSPPVVDLLNPDIRVSFNGEVHIDSLRKAVLIDPPIEGIWISGNGEPVVAGFLFRLPTDGFLRPRTTYAVLVRDDIALSGSHKLRQTELKIFVTNGFEITNPSAGSSRGVLVHGSVPIYFNIAADTAATTSAISIRRSDGSPVPYEAHWTNEMRKVEISSTNGWETGETYKVIVAARASSLEGVRLSYQHEFYVSTYE